MVLSPTRSQSTYGVRSGRIVFKIRTTGYIFLPLQTPARQPAAMTTHTVTIPIKRDHSTTAVGLDVCVCVFCPFLILPGHSLKEQSGYANRLELYNTFMSFLTLEFPSRNRNDQHQHGSDNGMTRGKSDRCQQKPQYVVCPHTFKYVLVRICFPVVEIGSGEEWLRCDPCYSL